MALLIWYNEGGGGGSDLDDKFKNSGLDNQESDMVDDTKDSLASLQEQAQQQEAIAQLAQELTALLVRTGQMMQQFVGQGGQTSGQGDDGTSSGRSDDHIQELLRNVEGIQTLDDVKNFVHAFVSLIVEQGPFPGWEHIRDELKKNRLTTGLLGPVIRECYEQELTKLKSQERQEKHEALTQIREASRDDLAKLRLEVSQSSFSESREASDHKFDQRDWKQDLIQRIDSLRTNPDMLTHVQENICSALKEYYSLSPDAEKDLQNAVKYLLSDVVSQSRSSGGAMGACISYAAVLSMMA